MPNADLLQNGIATTGLLTQSRGHTWQRRCFQQLAHLGSTERIRQVCEKFTNRAHTQVAELLCNFGP